MLGFALETQADFLPGAPCSYRVMDRLHAYCYFLEGLLPVLDRADCRQAYAQGIDSVSMFLNEIQPTFVRSDVYAQLLRVKIYRTDDGGAPEADALAGFQAGLLVEFLAVLVDSQEGGQRAEAAEPARRARELEQRAS